MPAVEGLEVVQKAGSEGADLATGDSEAKTPQQVADFGTLAMLDETLPADEDLHVVTVDRSGATKARSAAERLVTLAPERWVQPAAQTRTVSLTVKGPWARVAAACRTDFCTTIPPPQCGQGSAEVSTATTISAPAATHSCWAARNWRTCSRSAVRVVSWSFF